MIKLKVVFGSDEAVTEFQIQDGEILKDAVARAVSEVPLGEKKIEEVFATVVNGLHIDHEFWEFTQLKATDDVLITPLIRDGDAGTIFKQVAIVAITVIASYYLGPAGAGLTGVALGLTTAAITIGASLLLNALIPPPVPDGADGLNLNDHSYESSQMYSITGQSNTVKRFASVPKVYGNFRMFPNVVANPYTQLETDKDTGDPVQYLYVIYDFGFGPMRLSDLKIGDTNLDADSFTDFNYRFVDLNKPAVNEGPWDEQLENSFTLYKGDNEGSSLAIGLDGNKNEDDDISTWQTIQNSAPNTDGVGQQIILNFTNQTGLYSFASDGTKGFRQIDLDISFRKVGTTDWLKYNDSNYVSQWDSAGGDSSLFELNLTLADSYVNNTLFDPPANDQYYTTIWDWIGIGFQRQVHRRIASGTTKMLVVDEGFEINPGQPVTLNNSTFVGKVVSVADYIPNAAYKEITLDTPIEVGGTIFEYANSGTGGRFAMSRNLGSYVRLSNATPGRARIRRSESAAVYSSFRFTPKEPGQFEIRVQRLNTATDYTTSVADKLTWSSIATRFDRAPIITDKRHLFLELRIKATSQLNGTVSNLSGMVQSILDVYDSDTETWSLQESSNPAWIVTDLLTGQINKRPISKDRLHLASLVEWSEFCDEVPTPPPTQDYVFPRFSANFVFDYASTLQGLIAQVASAAQASLNIIDGKYGILIDRLRTTPIQIFTPRNSKGFQSSRTYSNQPNGVKITWVDPQADWTPTELVVYDDGFNEDNSNPDQIDALTTFGCTNNEQAWRFGRYNLAQNRLRQETISLIVDFEYLVCTRGDYVQVTQDVMRVGGTPARVKTVDVDNQRIVINDAIDILPATTYGYVYRASDGTIRTALISDIESADTFILPVDAIMPHAGDLIVIGEAGSIVFDCIVKSISPNDDQSANLTLVERAAAIYEAESSGVIPPYDPQISRTSNPDMQPPQAVENLEVITNSWRCKDGGYEYYIDLQWSEPAGSIYEYFSVNVNSGKGFVEVGRCSNGLFEYIVDPTRLDLLHSIKVVAVAATGRKLPLASVPSVDTTPETKSTPPSDVDKLSIDITNQVLQLSWPQVDDCDIAQYLIRYSPATTATWESSVPLLAAGGNASLASTQARKGTYLIKAIDFNGNQSENAVQAITTIPGLIDLNIIETIEESPDFLGSYDRTVKFSDSVLLEKEVSGDFQTLVYYEEGFYNFHEILDLGEIYTVRLQSLIQAEGFTEQDLMINWVTLDSVLQLASAQHSDWSIETQYRSTDTLNVMADWDVLADIVTIDAGQADNFTEWRTFFIGDATGRVFQFRLRLISNKPNVTPRVFDGTVKADMPDRIESFENETADAVTGFVVTYDMAFAGPGTSPNVQVTIDGAEFGDRPSFEYKTLEGFKLFILDESGVKVTRQVDVFVKGYGRKYSNAI